MATAATNSPAEGVPLKGAVFEYRCEMTVVVVVVAILVKTCFSGHVTPNASCSLPPSSTSSASSSRHGSGLCSWTTASGISLFYKGDWLNDVTHGWAVWGRVGVSRSRATTHHP
jgi:hypothetical protein